MKAKIDKGIALIIATILILAFIAIVGALASLGIEINDTVGTAVFTMIIILAVLVPINLVVLVRKFFEIRKRRKLAELK